MRVLVVPEDSRKDKFILKPLFKELFRSIGKPKTRIKVCEDPVLGSVDEVLKSSRIKQIIAQYPMIGIFIICVDRDGKTGRRRRWTEVRAEVQVKERYFDPLAVQREVSDFPGGGRKSLGEESARRITAIRQKCPEDFDHLARRLQDAVHTA